jgi:hypothetical protein
MHSLTDEFSPYIHQLTDKFSYFLLLPILAATPDGEPSKQSNIS